ncbi:hypothetical protein D3C85_1771100 [compost metagenome]
MSIDYLLGRTRLEDSVLDHDVRDFVENLDLTDEGILQKFSLTVDGKPLSPEEARRFIAFVRAERSLE